MLVDKFFNLFKFLRGIVPADNNASYVFFRINCDKIPAIFMVAFMKNLYDTVFLFKSIYFSELCKEQSVEIANTQS